MTDINNIEELKVEVQLLRDVLGVLIDKTQTNGMRKLHMRLYGVDDAMKAVHELNCSYNQLDFDN